MANTEQEPGLVIRPQRSQDPLAGVDPNGGPSRPFAHGAVKVKPSGRTSSDLDRTSTNQDNDNQHDHDDDYDHDYFDPNVDERSEIPYTDELTRLLIDFAVEDLAGVRSPRGVRDPAAKLSCLVSLRDEADSRLADVVADARDFGYGWEEIALRLDSTSPGAARKRYSAYTRWRANDRRKPVTSTRTGPPLAD